jgi:iron complex outermembrane recepter protein
MPRLSATSACCPVRRRPYICRFSRIAALLLAVGLVSESWASDSTSAEVDEQESLTHLSLEQLGNVDVTTVSKEPVKMAVAPAAVYVITQEDIRRSGATTIPEALRLAPGVEVARIDSVKWAVGIRGFQSRISRAVLVLIDGRSVYSPLFHGW